MKKVLRKHNVKLLKYYEMIDNRNNANEHSYLCLVAIYTIHVVFFHFYHIPESGLKMTEVTLPPQLQPMARWRTRSIGEKNNNHTFQMNVTTNEQESSSNPVIGGVEATLGQFPHQVSLRHSDTGIHFCGGNIIDEEWIVTAAHCMYSNNKLISASSIKINAGNLLLDEISSSSQSRRVKDIFVHEIFNMRSLINDIALLKLRSKLKIDNVTVAAKALRNESVADGTPCQVSGWGVTRYGTTVLNNELLYVDLPIINRTLCQQLMVNYSDIPEVMICAGHIEGGFDSCRGDSGGGLICDNVLTGLVSWGKECGLANFPGIYTNVNVFRDWILETMARNSSSHVVSRTLSPAAWGVLLGCLVFIFTYTDHEKLEVDDL